ncbi:hypothetical protein D9613_004771 [Agrocybe pediades]|uniref:Uncharacterized protein n=1 Tax=Agrocybe pediades TaxID=84607 RepID=A0A8H4QYK1_9AGAR|nr:hypothetical protein D9613_004771 [Agrocybe pediades]
MSSSNGVYALIQYGDDPFRHRFVDHESRPAFTIEEVDRTPNVILRLTRELEWSQQHPSIMGPDNSYFYMGPENAPGYVVYGNGRINIGMPFFLRKGKRPEGLCQNGRDYKWKIGSHRMECMDGRNLLAVWEVSTPDKEYYAKLIIQPRAMPLITEIVTALIVNRIALALGW